MLSFPDRVLIDTYVVWDRDKRSDAYKHQVVRIYVTTVILELRVRKKCSLKNIYPLVVYGIFLFGEVLK